jgi:hypothetical protein
MNNEGSIKALPIRLYEGSIKALRNVLPACLLCRKLVLSLLHIKLQLRLYSGSIKALLRLVA